MLIENLGVLVVIMGTILSAAIFTFAEIFILKLLKFGDPSKQIYYAILANISNLVAIAFGIGLLIAFTGIGLFVAMDKGYNSGEIYLTLAIVSIILVPLLIFLARAILFYLFKLGNPLVAGGYSLATTIASVIILAIIVFVLLAITS